MAAARQGARRLWIALATTHVGGACGLCACGSTDVIADVVQESAPGPTQAGSAAGESAAIGSSGRAAAGDGEGASGSGASGPVRTGTPELAAWCSGEGGLWLIRGDGQAAFSCADGLAARSFGRALCVCGTMSGPGAVTTATRLPDGELQSRGADVALNGAITITSAGTIMEPLPSLPSLNVGGELVLAGENTLQLAPGAQRVQGDLRSRAPLGAGSGPTSLRVDGDAWLPGASSLDPRALDVGGELVLSPAGADPSETQRWSAARSAGGTRRGDVEVAPPCPCDRTGAPDVPAMVRWAEANNDNTLLGFDPAQLYWVEQASTFSLPCGRFSIPTINGAGVISLRIDQPVALFVRDLLGVVEVQLGPRGSLDLFVSGVFGPRGGHLGDPERPSRTRIYVHDQTIFGPLTMVGELISNFYAPTVGVQSLGVQRRGSMVVRDAIVSESLRVEYDPRVRQLGRCGGQP